MKKLVILFLFFWLAGCATARVERYEKDVVYPPTDPARILVYTMKPEGRIFKEIGHITVEGAGSWAQVERVFKIKAAELGGDAVYLFSKTEEKHQYVRPHECHFDYGYYPYYRTRGYHHRHYYHYNPSRYYYCYGYQPAVETQVFISAVGVIVKY